MSPLLDAALVASVLAASVLYALYSLGPKTLRQRLSTALADLAARAPAALHLGRIERRLREAAGGSGACGGCESCGPPDAREPAGKEIRVPAASIGKRHMG
jgi:uncharacterized protein DUF6587